MPSPVIIRTSDRGTFKRCRTMWDFTSKMRQNYEPIRRYHAFDFGTAIHAGLEVYYDPATWGDLPVMQDNARLAFYKSFEELQKLIKVGDIEFELTFNESIELGMGMLEFYFTWAPKQDVNITPIYREIEFEVPIPGLEGLAVYQGRIDLIVAVYVEGEFVGYYIVDHKTAKQFGDTMWLNLDDQCGSYAWAIKQQLGLDIRGVIYNQLRKSPPHPPKQLKNGGFSVNKQQDTTFELYRQTLYDHGIDPREYRAILLHFQQNPKEYARRTTITYTDDMMAIMEQRIRLEAQEMMNPDIRIYPTPSMMNCPQCRFFGPCLQTQEGREPFMDAYEVRPPSSKKEKPTTESVV